MASVDAKKLMENVYPDKYGVHRLGTFGDYRERLRDAAGLLGFDFVEEDV